MSLDDASASIVAQVVGHLAISGPERLAEQEFVVSKGELFVPRLHPTPNATGILGIEEAKVEKHIQRQPIHQRHTSDDG